MRTRESKSPQQNTLGTRQLRQAPSSPNGAGPWHFAVKTMLILYGVVDEQALYFVLIVHTIQTLLVVALGIYAWVALSFARKRE